MSEYDPDEFYDEDGDNYFYVEDSYAIADDLAEHAVASPGPFVPEDDGYWDDLSRFEYWCDIEYDSDGGYNDVDINAGRKRKRAAASDQVIEPSSKLEANSKRTKTKGVHRRKAKPLPTISWRESNDVNSRPRAFDVDAAKPVALLKDWRERFNGIEGFPLSTRTTKLPQIDGEDATSQSEKEMPGVSESRPPNEDEPTPDASVPAVDALKRALGENLSALGLDVAGLDESVLLQFSMRILQEPEAADNIIGELTDHLLNGVNGDEEEEPDQFSRWVSKKAKASADGHAGLPNDMSKTEPPGRHSSQRLTDEECMEGDEPQQPPIDGDRIAELQSFPRVEMRGRKRKAESQHTCSPPAKALKTRARVSTPTN